MIIFRENSGFTLIETIIYIALFSLLMGTAFVTVFDLIEGSGKLSAKTITQEEGSFVMRKFNWVLTGAKTFSISGSELTVNKYNGDMVIIKLGSVTDAEKILINNTPITTENVQVTSLEFKETNPDGISVTAKIKTLNTDPLLFTITKYIRK